MTGVWGLSRESGDQPFSIESAKQCALGLQTEGFEVPRWEDLAEGLRPLLEEGDIFQPKHGWALRFKVYRQGVLP